MGHSILNKFFRYQFERDSFQLLDAKLKRYMLLDYGIKLQSFNSIPISSTKRY